MKRICDNVRYTNISSSDNFVENLKDKGYNMRRVKNTLKDENVSYREINAIVENSEGYKFELQFHTQVSFNAKQANHILYEEQRLDVTSTERIIELEAEMTKNNSKIGMP